MISSKLTQRRSRFQEATAPTLAGALVLIASFVNFITSNDYPVFQVEVGISVAILSCVALLVGTVYGVTGKLGRVILELTLLFIAIDLNFNGISVVLIFIPLTVLVWLRKSVLFLSVVSAVVIFSSFVHFLPIITPNRGATTSDTSSNKPVLLHIILDEHIGLEGILDETPRASQMRDKIKAFYLQRGFRLYGGAYSEYFHTHNSIPDILNYGSRTPAQRKIHLGMKVGGNKYFNDLGDMGYRIQVFQTFFIKYCNNDYVYLCRTTPSLDEKVLNNQQISTQDKTTLMLASFAKLSQLLKSEAIAIDILSYVLDRYGISLPSPKLDEREIPRAAGAVQFLDQLPPLLQKARAGDAYFVHVLFPHHPYALSSECRLKPIAEWVNRKSALTVEQTNKAYFDQLDCVLLKLEKVLEAVPEDSIVIVHGDHGSRITNHDPVIEEMGRFNDKDLISGYSALFAVRSKNTTNGYETERYPVSRLLKALVDSSFNSTKFSAEKDISPSVVLEDYESRPRERYPLPAWWVEGALQGSN